MQPMILAPLPILRNPDSAVPFYNSDQDFVDDTAIATLLGKSPVQQRQLANPNDLVLAADDMDFAGWQLPEPSRFIQTPPPPRLEIAENLETQLLAPAPWREESKIAVVPAVCQLRKPRGWPTHLAVWLTALAFTALTLKL
jgi:hypothetical protein